MTDEVYRIGELAELAGVTRRTVHYYINKGLIRRQRERGHQLLHRRPSQPDKAYPKAAGIIPASE